VFLVLAEKVQLDRMCHPGEPGTIQAAFFAPCNPYNSLKEAFENFEFMTTFALLTDIYLL
jgi:hypothetical protein